MAGVFITGASSGIGKELAYLFAQRKYDLFLLARSIDKLEHIKKEIENKYNVDCEIFIYDLSEIKQKQIKSLKTLIENKDLDILINCAGFGEITNFDKLSIEREIQMLNTNLNSPIILMRLFLEKALKIELNKNMTIINICSTAALYYHPYMAMYSTTKVGLLNYSLSISEEIKYRNKNIHILSICPGPTATPFFDESIKEKFGFFKKWEMSTESVAKEIMYAYDKGKSFLIVGFRNKILIEIIRILPIDMQLKLVAKHLRKIIK